MLLNNIEPINGLKYFVRFYRIIDFDFTAAPANAINIKAYRPRVEHCLQFTPFDNEIVEYDGNKKVFCKTAIFGQHTVLTQRMVGRKFLNFQVVFQPGVLNTLLKLPADELTNVYTSAEVFFGKEINNVNEKLSKCSAYKDMISVVEAFLMQQFYRLKIKLHPVSAIANELIDSRNLRSIEWYASQANLCYRQFDRAFKLYTGIVPKDFRMLVKLDHAYLLKNRNPGKDWLAIALDSGFYDYQHLTKNYKKFTGYSPTGFYQLEQNAPERCFGFFEH